MIYLIKSAGIDEMGNLIKLLGIMVGEENQFSPILEYYNPTSKIISRSNKIKREDFIKNFSRYRFKDNWFLYNQEIINYFKDNILSIDSYIRPCQVSYFEIINIVDKRVCNFLIPVSFIEKNLLKSSSFLYNKEETRELKIEYPIARHCYGIDKYADLIITKAFSKEELEYIPEINSAVFGIDSDNIEYIIIVKSIKFTEECITVESSTAPYNVTDSIIILNKFTINLKYIRPVTKDEIDSYEIF